MSRASHSNNVQKESADTTNDLSYNSVDSNMFDTSIIINELRNVPMTAERLKTLDDLIRLDDDDDITKQVESLQNFIRAKKAKQAAQNLTETNEQNANELCEPHINGALLSEDHRQRVSLTIISPNKCIIKANDSIIGERGAEERIEGEKVMRTNQRRSDEKRARRSSERVSKRSEERKSGRSEERRSRRSEERRLRHSEERKPRRSEERRSRRSEENRSGKSEERRHRRNEERARRSEERRLGRDERHPDDRRARRSEERRYRREESRMLRSEEKRLKASCPKGPRTPPNTPPPHNANEYDDHLMMKLPDGMDGRHMSYHDSIGAPNQYHQVVNQLNCVYHHFI